MAIVVEGNLACPVCREYAIEADPAQHPDGVDYDIPGADESPTPCGECAPHFQTPEETVLRTIVADWGTVQDSFGDTISPDMLPVVITVPAASRDEALQAAADKLQHHFGPDVAELHASGIERDWWFGFNDTDPLLRVCAVIVGTVALDDDEDQSTVIC
jgi:hypothetical protein